MGSRTRRAAALLGALLAPAALLLAPSAVAEPWGTDGADYDGVLCRLGGQQVALGAWTVNGTFSAYATEDVTGDGVRTDPAPLDGDVTRLEPGVAGFTASDIGALAYLIDRWGGGSAAELAEIGADVAQVAGGGAQQAQCLGQGGTSTARAASRLATARRLGGPYDVVVGVPAGTRPDASARVTVTVRSASGAGVPGADVTVDVGGAQSSVTTDASGVARTDVTVPSAAATTVTASVGQPSLVSIASDPPSVALGDPRTVRGSAVLRPVLHPRPAVSVQHEDLLLRGGTLAPTVRVSGTYGYSGVGSVTLSGPVDPPASGCAALGADAYRGDPVWSGDFWFTGDGTYGAGTSPDLEPGCYAVRGGLETTDSSPVEKASAASGGLTVSGLTLSTAAVEVAAAGGLRAVVTGDDPGGARVVTTVVARGPVAFGSEGCRGVRFARAATAATSAPTPATRAAGSLRATVSLPAVRRVGCYTLVARSRVTLDGREVVASAPLGAEGTVTAVIAPRIAVSASAQSGLQGSGMPATVTVSGTYGFEGTVRLGVTEGETVPVTGCADARFAPAAAGPTRTATVDGDGTLTLESPATTHNACYALTARLAMSADASITATTAANSADAVFLAGVDPDAGPKNRVQRAGGGDDLRVLVVYLVAVASMLAACGVIARRAFEDDRRTAGTPTWSLLG
ncbi:Ig-like domain-containing protein [Jatrophihabitans fulvus]